MNFPLAIRAVIGVFASFYLQGSDTFAADKVTESDGSSHSHLAGRWTNSLGMEFLPVPQTKALFCVWKTRIRDFQAFVNEEHYDATNSGWLLPSNDNSVTLHLFPMFGFNGLVSLSRRYDLKEHLGCWSNPGFNQGPTHPVCGISWEDANAFCSWLTKKERQSGVIARDQMYRLPTDAEWSLAAGNAKFLWGNRWPPPAGAGNFAGEEALAVNWPTNRPLIHGYRDGFPQTSPVGSFPANRQGLFDLVGNLREWCEDYFRKEMNSDERRRENPAVDFAPATARVLRGAWWGGGTPGALSSMNRGWAKSDARAEGIGFRVVLVRDDDDIAIDLVMEKLESYFKAGDYSYTFEVMYTPVMDRMGGKEKAVDAAKAIEAQMKEQKIVIVSWQAKKPYHYIDGGLLKYAIVPYESVMTVAGKTLKQTSYQLAVKIADAKWQFVNGDNLKPEIFEEFFPDFPKTVKLPKLQRAYK